MARSKRTAAKAAAAPQPSAVAPVAAPVAQDAPQSPSGDEGAPAATTDAIAPIDEALLSSAGVDLAPANTADAPPVPPLEERRFKPFDTLSTADQENPDKIEGEHLRRLGHQRGLSLSEMGRMSDDKIREQLRYIAHRQYDR